jgi:hypothetical protein
LRRYTKATRNAILDAMEGDAAGALLSAVSAEDAGDALRDMDLRTATAAVENMLPGRGLHSSTFQLNLSRF